MRSSEREVANKIWWRLVPLLTVSFFFSYLDRVNLGFAAVTMNRTLAFSNTELGTGAGMFAVGYALFGIPSTLLLYRFGARRWIALIMLAWALCSAATAFVGTPFQLMCVRFLLGVAEAGFIPGVIFYFSYWFASEYRGRVLSSFYTIGPLGLLIGGPMSSAVLSLGGQFGLAGWQWLFIIEAAPTVVLAAIVFSILSDRPDEARWLAVEERQLLMQELGRDATRNSNLGADHNRSPWSALSTGKVWALALIYLGIGTSGIGAVFFLPLMIRSMGFSVFETGLMAALPGVAALSALPLWGLWTDRTHHREQVVAAGAGAISAGLLGTAVLLPSPWALVPASLAMVGFYGCLAAFWTLPSAFLTGARAAAGIAAINVIGNLGNFIGPALLGIVSDRMHSYGTGLTCLASIAAVSCASASVTWMIKPKSEP